VFNVPTPNASNSGGFTGYLPNPIFNIQAGIYANTQIISISTNNPNSSIRYTINGNEPTATSTLYTGPITISSNTIVKARCFSTFPDILPSFIEINTYIIGSTHNLPVISLTGSFTSVFNGTIQTTPSSFEYFDKNGIFQFEGFGEAERQGSESVSNMQKAIEYNVEDEYGYNHEFDYQLFHTKTRQKFEKIILRAAGDDNFPGYLNGGAHIRDAFIQSLGERAGLTLDYRAAESCVVYLNGQYWGVYHMREKTLDPDYTEYYHGQKEEDLDWLRYWGGLTTPYGSSADWVDLYNFITTNSMADPVNYNLVSNRIEFMSVIDYMILNTWAINSDWIYWNTMWWRGNGSPNVKWRYVNWDMDNVFDLGMNYSGWPTTSYTASPWDLSANFTNTGPEMGHFDIFNALMNNYDFRNMYLSRFDQLNQTYFSSGYVIPFLDSMVANITPEMPAHIARWGGTLNQWQINVQHLKDEVLGRCSVITQGISACYGVVGLNEPKNNMTFHIYPNPSNGAFNITSLSKIKEIKVFDLCGSAINFNSNLTNENGARISIDQKGIYIIHITAIDDGKYTQKLVVH
jgi:hypothetical protein